MDIKAGAIDPTRTISEGWEIIKSQYWLFFAMCLVFLVITFAISIVLGLIDGVVAQIISLAFVGSFGRQNETLKNVAPLLPQIISQILSFFTNLILGTFSGILLCGIYRALSNKLNGGNFNFGDLFAGFPYWRQCAVVSVFMALVQLIFVIVFLAIAAAVGFSAIGSQIITADGKLNPQISGTIVLIFGVVGIVYLIFAVLFGACVMFIYPLIAERGLSASEAVSLSVKGGLKNLIGVVALIILQALMAIGGLLACVIGLLFVMPVIYASTFAAYRRVFDSVPPRNEQFSPPPPIFS
jgi:hypothetical protein